MDENLRRRLALSFGLVAAPGEPDSALRRRARELLSRRALPTLEAVEAILREIPGVERVSSSEGAGEVVFLVTVSGDSEELLVGVRDFAKRRLEEVIPAGVRSDVIIRPPGERGDALESAFRLGGLDAAAAMMREGGEDDEGVR